MRAYPTAADYEPAARRLSDEALDYALKDIAETLAIWRDEPSHHDYVMKLNAEWDAYTAEKQRRQRPSYLTRNRKHVANLVRDHRNAGNDALARWFARLGQEQFPRKEARP